MPNTLQKFELSANPFEPAAAGAPVAAELVFPQPLAKKVLTLLDEFREGQGVKAVVIVGDYGSGKTCLLQWLHLKIFPERRIKSFYFDNPGVQFYDLANALLRTIGRKDFAKFIWELAKSYMPYKAQGDLFRSDFEEYLSVVHPRQQRDIAVRLQEAIKETNLVSDDQIAHCLARIVTDLVRKPYFEYRDFVPRQKESIVAEGEEAPYFGAILQTILKGTGASGVAFLIDEFEEIGLQKRLSKRAAHDYLVTLKRLINLAQSEANNFWILLSMTRDAYDTTKALEPALADRLAGRVISIEPLEQNEAADLMRSRIDAVRPKQTNVEKGSLFPFPETVPFHPSTYSNPRRLVKTCFLSLSRAETENAEAPFSEEYLQSIENESYPPLDQSKRERS